MNTLELKTTAAAALGKLSAQDGMRPIWLAELKGDVSKYINHLEQEVDELKATIDAMRTQLMIINDIAGEAMGIKATTGT